MNVKTKLTVTHEYSGLSDYWSGNGRRWNENAGCAFAFYGPKTTLKECVDQWVDDFSQGGDFDTSHLASDPWEDVTSEEVRAAILEALSEQGRADYESGAIAECAAEYASANGDDIDDDFESPISVILIELAWEEVSDETNNLD